MKLGRLAKASKDQEYCFLRLSDLKLLSSMWTRMDHHEKTELIVECRMSEISAHR